ncbi:hypothetical protein MNBD_GAMMA22-922 [hydrothermal vent metagenome]|uniref:Uncharacterized protein n=1 Tax=hydrothermal vent metagenome TaxID=652676 RepID=A0A3B1ARJ1_9ZZZZ
MKFGNDPDIYAIAFRLTNELHKPKLAIHYFNLSENAYQKVINEKYIYTVGGLAQI